jgi:hypothetical protein
VTATRVSIYLCPSETQDKARQTPVFTHYPLNYSFNEGTWFIYDPVTGKGGDGAFYPNKAMKISDLSDGTSNTLAAAENKAYAPSKWDTLAPNALGIPAPATPADLMAYSSGGTFDLNGHTEWVEGDVHETGFTTTFTPNTFVPYVNAGTTQDIDLTSMRDGESITVPTYAAVTARSYHVGNVMVLLMDGSVRSVSNNINLGIWRGIGTRAGGEVIGDF